MTTVEDFLGTDGDWKGALETQSYRLSQKPELLRTHDDIITYVDRSTMNIDIRIYEADEKEYKLVQLAVTEKNKEIEILDGVYTSKFLALLIKNGGDYTGQIHLN